MTAKTKPLASFEHKTLGAAWERKRGESFNHFTRKTIHKYNNQTVITLLFFYCGE
jgi:hypothetical protein